MNRICIIGGGASGMTAAIAAARKGADVVILEQKEKLGKKILATGNGRCNLTNEYMTLDCYRGENKEIVSSILNQFGVSDTLAFFEGLGVLLKKRDTYVYPRSDQASTILEALNLELKRLKVQQYTNTCVTGIKREKNGFRIYTEPDGRTYKADKVILSAGGKASSKLGSNGSGYTLAKSMGHKLVPVVPALVQLKAEGEYFKKVAGVRTECRVSLYVNGKKAAEDTGELQLTDYGISGIPVFQVSRFAAYGLYEKKKVTAKLDFLPTMNREAFAKVLMKRRDMWPEEEAENILLGVFPKKLIPVFLKESGIRNNVKIKKIDNIQIERIVKVCKQFGVTIYATNSFDQAQICAGGVCTREVEKSTMESRYVRGLYITGELLDIDGICGGYSLQIAWATGYIAGVNAAIT